MNGSTDNLAIIGVPPETPKYVRPSATGLVTGPVDGETNVVVADTRPLEEERVTLAAGGELIGQADDGAPLIEGPNSQ